MERNTSSGSNVSGPSGKNRSSEGGGSVNRSSATTGKNSVTTYQTAKDPVSSLNRDSKIKIAEEKDPYIMDLSEDLDEPTSNSLSSKVSLKILNVEEKILIYGKTIFQKHAKQIAN